MEPTQPASNSFRTLRDVLRWVLALAVLWFLGSRLAADWPTIRPALGQLSWTWLALSLLPAVAYFFFRVQAWRKILLGLNVHVRFGVASKVWANGEIIRYIPGNVWSVVGRLAQSKAIGTDRSTVFMSMVIEALVLVLAAIGVSALTLVTYSAYDFPYRGPILLLIFVVTVLAVSVRFMNRLVRLIERVLRRKDPLPMIGHAYRGYAWMIGAWVAYALFQVAVAASLDALPNGTILTMIGIFTLSWLVGYLSFLTPSGLGVREVVLVWLLQPYVDSSTALLIAVVSRVMMIVVEAAIVGGVNLIERRRPA